MSWKNSCHTFSYKPMYMQFDCQLTTNTSGDSQLRLWSPNLCTNISTANCVCWFSERHQSAAIDIIKVYFTFALAHWQIESCTASKFTQYRNPKRQQLTAEQRTVHDATNHIKSVLVIQRWLKIHQLPAWWVQRWNSDLWKSIIQLLYKLYIGVWYTRQFEREAGECIKD